MNSPFTTWFGLAAGAGLAVSQIPGIPPWLATAAKVVAAIGAAGVGVCARDNNKSSEDVGLKK